MKRVLFLIVPTALIVLLGMYVMLRAQVSRGIRLPDAVPVTNVPVVPSALPELSPVISTPAASASGVLGVETALFQDVGGTFSFRYSSGWNAVQADPGAGTGAYGRILSRITLVPTFNSGWESAAPGVDIEISEIPAGASIEPLTACRGLQRECGVVKISGQDFARSVTESSAGVVTLEYATFSETRFYRLHASVSAGPSAAPFVEAVDTLASSIRIDG